MIKISMSISSLSRFLSLSISPKTVKISALYFSTSLADKLYTHMQNNPNNVEKSLSSIKPKLDYKCVTEVLHKCSLNNSQMGLRFFVWAGYHSNYRHSAILYGKACKLFNIKQNPQIFTDLFEVYRAEKCAVSVKTFEVILNLCKECRLPDEALLVLRKMQEFNIFADTNAYTIVIRLFCDRGDMDLAEKLMEEMSSNDLCPNMVTCISMIKGFCDIGRLEEGCRLFQEMKEHGCAPNVVAYSALLDGICRFGSVERALELLEEMEKVGGDCNPNVLTYTSVIQGLCEKGRTTDAIAILDRMETCGCAPNRVTISTLLKRLCMNDRMEEAYRLIDRVNVTGSVSYGDCCSCLVVCLIKIKKIEEAEELFRRALVNGVKLDGLACNVMIRELCLEKRMLDGYHLYNKIEKLGFLSSIDSDVYSILLVGLCQQGHSVEASELARSMLEKKIRVKHPHIDQLVEHLKQLGVTDPLTELARIER